MIYPYLKMEADLRKVYNENKNDVARIKKGIEYLCSVPHFVVCYKANMINTEIELHYLGIRSCNSSIIFFVCLFNFVEDVRAT